MNLFSIVEDGAKNCPDVIAIADDRHCLSYSDLHVAAESLATEMQRAGIKAGDKVGLMFPKGVEDVVVSLAVMRVGGIVIPISPALKALEIVQLAEKVSADAFCYSSCFQALIAEGRRRTFKNSIWKQSAPLCLQWAETSNTSQEERKQLQRLNAASIGFSSGTTSEAKGIILSHDTLWERARRESEIFSISCEDCILYLLSMTYSLAPPIAATLVKGATIVIADGMDLQALPQLVARYDVTLVYASPLVYRMILNEGGATLGCLGSVRYLLSTGNSLPNTTAEEFSAKVRREIVQRYGLNECGLVLANLSEDASMRGAVGVPARMEVKLASEEGALLEGEATGELLVRGPGLFEGYYRPWRLRDECWSMDGLKPGIWPRATRMGTTGL
jgi:acyl-CoA synthetase (AMP-forming)/AMP-acid ligase II